MAGRLTADEQARIARSGKFLHTLTIRANITGVGIISDTIHSDGGGDAQKNVEQWGTRTSSAFNVSLANPGQLAASSWTIVLRNDHNLFTIGHEDSIFYDSGTGNHVPPQSCNVTHYLAAVTEPEFTLLAGAPHFGTRGYNVAQIVELPCNAWLGRITDLRNTEDSGVNGNPRGKFAVMTMEPIAAPVLREVITADEAWTTDTGLNVTV